MAKQYPNVLSLIKDISSKSFANKFESYLAERRFSIQLASIRAAKGLTEEDIARLMNCSVRKVKRIEQSEDSNLSLGDIFAYAKAIKMTVNITLKEASLDNRKNT